MHTAQRQTNLIIGKSLITAESVAQELRQRLADVLDQSVLALNQDELLRVARDMLRQFEPILAENLQAADLAAWVAGFNQVARQLPPWAVDLFGQSWRPPGPPRVTLPGLFGGDSGGELRFPLLDNALQSLIDRNILTRPEFDQLDSTARARAFTVAGEFTEGTIDTIRDTLADTLQYGASLENFRDKIEEAFNGSPIGPAHLETVYRTNVQAAFRDGRESLASNSIVAELFPYAEYIPIHDGRVREEHEALGHLGIDGTGVYRRDDPFWDHFTPPWDYNCLLPETVVSGNIHSGLKSWYDGEAVKIVTDRGHEFTVTANHPIFSPKCVIPAGLVSDGDYLLCDPEWRPCVEAFSAASHDEKQRPAKSEDVFRSLEKLSGVSRVPSRRNDLHSDAKFGDGYIDVVGSNRELLQRLHAETVQAIGNFALPIVQRALMGKSRSCNQARLQEFPLLASHGGPSSAALSLDGASIMFDPVPLFQLCFRATANLNASVLQSIRNCGTVASVGFAEILKRFAGKVSLNKFFNGQGNSRGRFTTCRVVYVSRFHYRGPVYDFETFDGWQLACGVKISNCRCAVNLMTVDKAASKGVKEAQHWRETGEKPIDESRLPAIPFRPREGFGYRGRSSVAIRMAADRQQMLFEKDKQRSLDFEQKPKPKPPADDNPWQPYVGPRGGRGWKHSGTGTVVYQTERPGAGETAAEVRTSPEARRKAALERSKERSSGATEAAQRRAFLASELTKQIGAEDAAIVADVAHGFDFKAGRISYKLKSLGISEPEAFEYAKAAENALKQWHTNAGIGDAVAPEPEAVDFETRNAREKEAEAKKLSAATRWAESNATQQIEAHTVTKEQWAALHWVKKRDEAKATLAKFEKLKADLDSDVREVWRKADDKLSSSHWKAQIKKWRHPWNDDPKDKGSLEEALTVLRDTVELATQRVDNRNFETWDKHSPYKSHEQAVMSAVESGKDVAPKTLEPYWYSGWIPAKLRQARDTQERVKEFRDYRDGKEHAFYVEQIKRARQRSDAEFTAMQLRAVTVKRDPPEYKRPDWWNEREREAINAHLRLKDICKESGGLYLELEANQVKPELREEYDTLVALRSKWHETMAAERVKERDADTKTNHDWLAKVIGESGGGKVAVSGGEFLEDEGKERLDEAVSFLQRFVSPKLGTIPFHIERSTAEDLRESAGGDVIHAFPKTSAWVWVHEAGHIIDGLANDEIGRLSKAYCVERLKRDNVEPEHPGAPYHPYEIMHKDGLRDQYCGKFYTHDTSEILSMGIQFLFDDAHKFHQEDPSHFAYTLAAIRGLL